MIGCLSSKDLFDKRQVFGFEFSQHLFEIFPLMISVANIVCMDQYLVEDLFLVARKG